MANIYALQGTSNSGKSSTINQLLQLISAKYPQATHQILRPGSKEVKVILHPIRGMRVGIESLGDPNSHLQRSLMDFRNANCDIVFCACRTSGMTVNWINAMSPPDKVLFIPKKPENGALQASSNAATANQLMQLAGI